MRDETPGPMTCLDDDSVLAYVDGALSPDERAALARHLDGCAPCRRLVSDVVRGASVRALPALLGRLAPATLERMAAAPTATVRPETQSGLASAATPVALPKIPTAAGDLELREVLGEGGMGRVVLALQRSVGREVAVKSLLPRRRSAGAEAALLAEGRCAGALEHPNIVPVHALGRDEDDGVVLVMKRLEGTSWRERVRQEGLERNLEILIQVCNAVEFAHTRGVLHRDIKPGNVMLGDFGEVTLVDWGVALRLAEREAGTELAGTPCYMAPEMLTGGLALSQRTDVYLLGATLHEILTGRPPHTGATLREILASVAAPQPPALDGAVPEALGRICQRALDPLPEGRFRSAAELRDALLGFLRHRASNRLAEEALGRLAEARGAEPAARRRLLIECQFGLRQALREWAESDVATPGLAACVAELARLELSEGNRGAAELLMAELREPPGDLVDALAALVRRQEADEAARTRLQALERDQDLGVSRRARVVFASVAIGWNLLMILAWFLLGRPQTTPAAQARETTILFLSTCIVLAIWRRPFLRNRVNRQVILCVLLSSLVIVLHEVLSVWRPQPVEETLAEALGLLGLSMALMALLLVRWLWPVAVLTLGASVVATAFPPATFPLWGMATTLPFIGMIIAWSRPPKPPPAPSPRGP